MEGGGRGVEGRVGEEAEEKRVITQTTIFTHFTPSGSVSQACRQVICLSLRIPRREAGLWRRHQEEEEDAQEDRKSHAKNTLLLQSNLHNNLITQTAHFQQVK